MAKARAKRARKTERPGDAELVKILLRRATAVDASYQTAPMLLLAAESIYIDMLRQLPEVDLRTLAPLKTLLEAAEKRVTAMKRSAGSA